MFILTMHIRNVKMAKNDYEYIQHSSKMKIPHTHTNTQKLLRVLSKHRLSLASLYFSSILAIEITANVKANGHE